MVRGRGASIQIVISGTVTQLGVEMGSSEDCRRGARAGESHAQERRWQQGWNSSKVRLKLLKICVL